ncbi:FAD-dependent oxidoreductase [Enemella sp. A6]|uniref:FAD-dependent oxidoreductase n=1 Tax=Enemella sp. A6 TaxID=3440152 RepID=UPI003EC10F7F
MAPDTLRPLSIDEVTDWADSADVVILGYGCAGASAALTAHEQDASVIVLEMLSGGGGSSAMSGGEMYLGGGTPIQQACGFDDTAEAMAEYLMAALGPNAPEDKIRLYARDSLEHYAWLTGHGVPFKESFFDQPSWVPPTDDGLMWLGENAAPFNKISPMAPRGHRVQSDGFGGKVLMRHLMAAVDATDIRVQNDSRATRLILDGDRVAGVVARSFGVDRAIRADKGVIITTGGFIDNPRMVEHHAPQLIGIGTNSDGNDNGSGILLGQSVGGAVRRMSAGQIGIAFVPAFMVRGIVVNWQGQRIINEDVYPGRVGQTALYGHDLEVWVILDEQGFEEVSDDLSWGARPHHVAETVAELEELCGFPTGSLQDTVAYYNEHAAQGEDPLFGKDPRWLRPLTAPFGAMNVRNSLAESPEKSRNDQSGPKGSAAGVFTIGGLHTTVDGEVCDLSGEPIPGLYAAGRASSGLHGWGYVSGTSLGDGTYFGRRAGRAAAG